MYLLTFKPPTGEIETIKIKDELFNVINQKLENDKIIVLNGESYKTQYFISMKKIKEKISLKLPEFELTEEQRLKNCEKLAEMKKFYKL